MIAGKTEQPRWVTIDLLKGFAILCVLLIHSKALGDSLGFQFVVDRAVPIFVILFGLNSTLWWRRRTLQGDLTTWYGTRVRRIMVPYWASLPIWWALALWYQPIGVAFPWWLAPAQLCGYALYIGTGWFVTMILLLVAFFPLLVAAVRRVGIWPVVFLAVLGELVVAHWRLDLFARFGLLNYLVFPPRVLGHVAFGMVLATRMARLGALVGSASAGLFALAVAVQQSSVWPELTPYVDALIDLPLTLALLVVFRAITVVPVVAPALAWLGVNSWGLYLGQLLVHNAVVYRCGFLPDLAPNLAACHFPFGGDARLDRWLYTLLLLVGAMAFIWLGGRALRMYGALRRAGLSLPDLSR